jgi:RND family efflux transporter MFP subunit
VGIAIEEEDGELQSYEGYRVQHDLTLRLRSGPMVIYNAKCYGPQRLTMKPRKQSALGTSRQSTFLGIVCLVGIALLQGCEKEPVAKTPPVARPIKMLLIGDTGGGATLEFPGSVSAAQSAELAFDVPGRMLERIVEEGQLVSAGEVVAKLDARDYVAKRDRARAQRDTKKAEYERYKKALEKQAVTRQEVDLRKGAYDVSRADLAVAVKALQETQLQAPFAGRIARRLVDDFANVQAKQPVLLLQDESSLELRVDVAERDWARGNTSMSKEELTQVGKPRVEIASIAGRQIPAFIKEMSTTADPTTRTYAVTFGFENPSDLNISPGMTGKVIVDRRKVAQSSAIYLPSHAVAADEQNNPFVWLIAGDPMKASRRAVSLGELSGDSVTVTGGLAAGDRVAVSGVNSLTEGMLVREMDAR